MTAPQRPRAEPRRLMIAAAIAVAVDLAAYWIGTSFDASMRVDGTPYDINAIAVVAGSAIPLLIGGLIASALIRRRPGASRWLAWGGLGFALLTIAVPAVGATDLPTAITLAVMHLTVGVTWATALAPWRLASPAARNDQHGRS